MGEKCGSGNALSGPGRAGPSDIFDPIEQKFRWPQRPGQSGDGQSAGQEERGDKWKRGDEGSGNKKTVTKKRGGEEKRGGKAGRQKKAG